MNILFIGDVFGTLGRRILSQRLPALRAEHAIDVCIANAENTAGGYGATLSIVRKLHHHGVDIITGGNHSFSGVDAQEALRTGTRILRPANFPPGNPGAGSLLHELPGGRALGVINLMGGTFAGERLDCPFAAAKRAVEELSARTRCILIDFHAEATSEKRALFFHLDGTISALVGTHTHVQTADENVSPNGTAYITDAGMTGPEDSCIGMKPEHVIRRFLLQTTVRFEPSAKGPMLNGVVIAVDDETGRARSIRRIYERIDLQ